MARVNTVGVEEIEKMMLRRAGRTRPKVQKMLEYAGEEVAKATRVKAEEYGLRDTGKLIKSIKASPPEIHTDSGKVEVWPKGSRKNGRKRKRNALVGFVIEQGRSYGNTKRKGIHFFEEATDDIMDSVQEGMADIWHEGE